MTRTLRLATASRMPPAGRGTIAAVLRWEGDPSPRTVVRTLPRRAADTLPYRALLLGLWEARRMGARALRLSTDEAEVATQVTGAAPPPAAALGLYLQARALLNAFHAVAVIRQPDGHDPDAEAAAAACAGAGGPRNCADLPLWAAAS